MRRAAGFTLVELVMVIVLLAIVATISVQFVALSTQGAIDTGDRQQRALKAVVVSEQITRMLREAFPLSVRVTGPTDNCIEWLPIVGATRYTELPKAGGSTIEVVPFSRTPDDDSVRAVVYGYGGSADDVAAKFYQSALQNPGPISPEIVKPIDNSTVPVSINLDAPHRFSAKSPARRLYVVSRPQALCSEPDGEFEELALYRGYNVGASYDRGNRDVLAANLKGPAEFFVKPISLRRAAVVSFSFDLATPGSTETLEVSQEVQIRNVP
ncbi:type II secretion system protein [Marinobacter zhanjiangensis]|uniref:MSHA biogenesis protein MshO n=1 Tax=Marinobacter zhanjiangensis TaxID=578215 RepID=A0ABQ3B5S4_9GAMM|nr:type II secretion system protein [Marinobacter zhanjiangensis]GGY80976.1 MSHA biogenesis protein MshO [Marinobacter zhanjiangensis]